MKSSRDGKKRDKLALMPADIVCGTKWKEMLADTTYISAMGDKIVFFDFNPNQTLIYKDKKVLL